MLIRSSALCQDVRPFIIAIPYSVTMYMEFARVSVTILPLASVGRMRLTRLPALSVNVEDMQMKDLPPLDA